MNKPAYLVFVSHSGEDSWVAKRIADCIESRGGSTFLDLRDIRVGFEFEAEIRKALRTSNELVVLATPWSLTRPYVWMEIGSAWFRRLPIVVLLLGLTPNELRARLDIPAAIHSRSLLHLNDVDKYFDELGIRVRLNT